MVLQKRLKATFLEAWVCVSCCAKIVRKSSENRPEIAKIAPGSRPKRQNLLPEAFEVQVFAPSSSQVRFLTIFGRFLGGSWDPKSCRNSQKSVPKGYRFPMRFRTSVSNDFAFVLTSKMIPKATFFRLGIATTDFAKTLFFIRFV